MRILVALLFAGILPGIAHAEEAITRRDGYLLIWESIRRPAYETTQVEPFADVPKGAEGELEITYGKRRGILEKEDTYFFPDAPLYRNDALLWLYRTRNVDELPAMQLEDVPALAARYPIATLDEHAVIHSREELFSLMQQLDDLLANEIHEVSFYADDFHGEGTAFGETFDKHDFTAAHRSFPQNTLVRVTNLDTGKSVVVRINDRGPYVEGRDMDLSKAAFEKIAPVGSGVIFHATFQRLGDVELVSSCSDQPVKYQRRITRDVRFHRGVPHTLERATQLALGSNRWFIVRGIRYPDGTFVRVQDFVAPDDRFMFVPNTVGEYTFLMGTVEGREREMRMNVVQCAQ